MHFKSVIQNLQYQISDNLQHKTFCEKLLNLLLVEAPKAFEDSMLVSVHGRLKTHKVIFEETKVTFFDFEHSHYNFSSYDFAFISNLKSTSVTDKLIQKFCEVTGRDIDRFKKQVHILGIIEILKKLLSTNYKKWSI